MELNEPLKLYINRYYGRARTREKEVINNSIYCADNNVAHFGSSSIYDTTVKDGKILQVYNFILVYNEELCNVYWVNKKKKEYTIQFYTTLRSIDESTNKLNIGIKWIRILFLDYRALEKAYTTEYRGYCYMSLGVFENYGVIYYQKNMLMVLFNLPAFLVTSDNRIERIIEQSSRQPYIYSMFSVHKLRYNIITFNMQDRLYRLYNRVLENKLTSNKVLHLEIIYIREKHKKHKERYLIVQEYSQNQSYLYTLNGTPIGLIDTNKDLTTKQMSFTYRGTSFVDISKFSSYYFYCTLINESVMEIEEYYNRDMIADTITLNITKQIYKEIMNK